MKTLKQIREVKKPTGKLKDACWTGYTAVGTKQKNGRTVPNCVPEEVVFEDKDPEYSDPYMAVNQLRTIMHNAQEMIDLIGEKTDLPEWVESKITLAEDYIMTVANYMRSELKEETLDEEELDPSVRSKDMLRGRLKTKKTDDVGPESDFKSTKVKYHPGPMTAKNEEVDLIEELSEMLDEKAPAWQRKEGKSESGGLNKKGIASYRRENPGSKLSMAVTTKPSKLKKGSKAWNRRKSFCSRMSGMKKRLTSAKTANDPNSRINKSLRKWNC
jgi:hypothetical protein